MTFNEFVKYSKKVGKNQDLVQAGGGNISIKLDTFKMLVKASGMELSKTSKKKGHVTVDYAKIRGFIKKISLQKNCKEKDYIAALAESSLHQKQAQPSMETGFHAVLDKAVIHTHPVAINSLACTKNAEKFLNQAFGRKNFSWVPYKSPGAELSASILLEKEKKRGKKSFVALLENHGLIVSGGSLKECYEKTIMLEKKARKAMEKKRVKVYLPSNLKIKKIGKNKIKIKGLREFVNNKKFKVFSGHFLFPDAAIYLEKPVSPGARNSKVTIYKNGIARINEKNPGKKRKIQQVFYASLCTMMNILQFDSAKHIPQKKVFELQNMALEKIRKKVK